MDIALFSFEDAVHNHVTIGFVRGCIACAQTEADLSLSRKAVYAGSAKQSLPMNRQMAHAA